MKPYSATTRCANRLTNTEQAAHRVAPEFAAFLTRHISDTVKSWDARDMSRQIELNIGKDLQFIRINGTRWGTIGLLLWLLADPRCCICILVSNDTIRTIALINIPQEGDDAQDFHWLSRHAAALFFPAALTV